MDTYERQVVQTTRVEFHVPAPPPWAATWTEVIKATRAAHAELWEAGDVPHGQDAADDQIRIEPRDDVIVVSYERTTTNDTAREDQA